MIATKRKNKRENTIRSLISKDGEADDLYQSIVTVTRPLIETDTLTANDKAWDLLYK